MAEDLTNTTSASESASPFPERARTVAGLSYQLGLGILAIVLLISRTEPGQLSPHEWLLLFLFLVISVICEELGFSLGRDLRVDLGGLFNGAAVLTLGFNGVWVSFLANLYWLARVSLRVQEPGSLLQQLAHGLFNLSMNTLPLWLGLLVYFDLLGGKLPLADLSTNLVPALAYVLVGWLVLFAGVYALVVVAERGVKGATQWFRNILTGFALTICVPALFSPALAVILNSLGLGFFLYITAALLGVSLMARRLAHTLASERQRVRELTALNTFAADIIHSPPSVEVTGELLARHTPRFLPEADFELCLFEAEEQQRRQVVVDWRNGAAQPASEAPLTAPWVWLRDQRQPLHVADLDQVLLPFAWDDVDGSRPRSLLLVPLLASSPASPEAERCIGGILMKHARGGAFTPEVLPSITALANQLAAALENARLHQEALAHGRLERELALARGIQTSFLPAKVPDVEGWTFVASLEPAHHVSGDFYDFIPLAGNRLGVLIADVADKGMPAALYMALARTLIRAHAPDHAADPAACLLAVNDQILADTQSDLFVTVFYGILDPATGEMCFTNAGHNPPYFCRRDGRPAEPLRNTGMALGVLPGVTLDRAQVTFAPGDYLVLYTDGVTEAHDRKYNEFGSDRLLAEIAGADSASPATIHHCVRAAVEKFTGDAPQSDDLTLMVVAREGPAAG